MLDGKRLGSKPHFCYETAPPGQHAVPWGCVQGLVLCCTGRWAAQGLHSARPLRYLFPPYPPALLDALCQQPACSPGHQWFQVGAAPCRPVLVQRDVYSSTYDTLCHAGWCLPEVFAHLHRWVSLLVLNNPDSRTLRLSPGFDFGFSLTGNTSMRCRLIIWSRCAFGYYLWGNS